MAYGVRRSLESIDCRCSWCREIVTTALYGGTLARLFHHAKTLNLGTRFIRDLDYVTQWLSIRYDRGSLVTSISQRALPGVRAVKADELCSGSSSENANPPSIA